MKIKIDDKFQCVHISVTLKHLSSFAVLATQSIDNLRLG